MSEEPQVVITGVGVVSPIGIGIDPFWASLCEGRSGVGPHSLVQGTPMPVHFGAAVTDFDPKQYVKPRKSLKVMCHEIQMGVAAASMAVEHSGIDTAAIDSDRLGVVFGAEMLYGPMEEWEEIYRILLDGGVFDYERFGETVNKEMYPLWMLKYLPNMIACHIGIAHDARGPNNTMAHDNVSSLLAVIEAVRVIQRGHADVMIVGGSGSRIDLTQMLYRTAANMSHREDKPAAASRPFDADRDGLVNGEGAGAFVLETREHAETRGAEIYTSILGCGNGFEARMNGAQAAGIAIERSIQQALTEGKLNASDVGHVNAHGLSTIEDDQFEAQAIQRALGDTPVTAPKSFFGNLGAGTGAVEMAVSVLGLHRNEVTPTLNYETPDPACPVQVIRDRPLTDALPYAVVLNQSGPGQAVAVLLGHLDAASS
ncbi:MAG: 3-oxoacyl-ACP synthase [Planctomycetaceae bacterium]|nr:3-oxoacyl-ACP synthase [Planctomycetaceae bacterium]